jgi:hypothetical protein
MKGPKRSYLFSKTGQQELRQTTMSPAMQWRRKLCFQLLEPLNEWLLETMLRLKQQGQNDTRIKLLPIQASGY